MSTLKRRNIIAIFIILMVTFIVILDVMLITDHTEASEDFPAGNMQSSIPVEEGVFERSGFALHYRNMPEDSLHGRALEAYYENRAYAGAPPRVPHEMITSGTGIGGKDCLQCHGNGGFVERFNAFAPVTPHPQLINCNQCHVPVNTNKLFRESTFTRAAEPKTKQAAMQGSPPVIPHKLFMRENCLSCHAGPSAPKEIRVSHPERVNCRQCHVPGNTTEEFNRTADLSRMKDIVDKISVQK